MSGRAMPSDAAFRLGNTRQMQQQQCCVSADVTSQSDYTHYKKAPRAVFQACNAMTDTAGQVMYMADDQNFHSCRSAFCHGSRLWYTIRP